MTALQRAILGLLKVRRQEPPPLSGARILTVQIAGMGDFTLAVPALRALRRANPSGRLDLLTSGKGRRAAEGCPYIDEIESLDFGPPSAAGAAGALSLLPLIRRVRRRRYDFALNLMGLYSPQGAVRMGLLLRSLGIPLLAGRDTRGTGTFYHFALDENLASPRNERDTHLEFVRRMGGAADAGDDLEAWPSADDERRTEELAGSLPGRGPIVGVNPGTDRPEKTWPPDRYLEVMRRLEKERGARFLLTGGAAEAALTSRLAAALGPGASDTAGKVSYQGTVSLIRKCDLFLTSDTAALHLAWAAGAPAVVLFREENLGRYRPATERIRCLAGNELKDRLDFSVEEVLGACLERLDSSGGDSSGGAS